VHGLCLEPGEKFDEVQQSVVVDRLGPMGPTSAVPSDHALVVIFIAVQQHRRPVEEIISLSDGLADSRGPINGLLGEPLGRVTELADLGDACDEGRRPVAQEEGVSCCLADPHDLAEHVPKQHFEES
jgi:hypothetical protein